MNRKHFRIKVKGKVQGVFFRASAAEEAKKLKLNGFVRNEQDGSVCIEAEGDEDSLNLFIKWCAVGPPRATVESITKEESSIKNYPSFEIKR